MVGASNDKTKFSYGVLRVLHEIISVQKKYHRRTFAKVEILRITISKVRNCFQMTFEGLNDIYLR